MHGSSFNYTNGMQLSIVSYTGHGMPSFCNNTAGTQTIFTSKEQLKQRYRICKSERPDFCLLTKMCKNQIIQKKKTCILLLCWKTISFQRAYEF